MARRTTQDYGTGKAKRRKSKDRGDWRKTSDVETADRPETLKWWLADSGTEAQSRLWTWVERLRGQWAIDGIQDLIHEAIYSDEPIRPGGYFDGQNWRNGSGGGGLCILNAIKSVVDTASARLTKVRSMPIITARNATYEEEAFATEISDVLRIKLGGTDMEKSAPLLIRDFCIRGTAVGKVERNGGDTTTKRVPIYEFVWDHREAQHGTPRTMAHVRPESRDVMLAKYPKYADAINGATLYTRTDPWMQFVYQGPQIADMIDVAEAWHLPSSPDADDGQHIIAIRGIVVLRECWNVPRYPYEMPHWTAPLKGVRGKGLVAEHAAAQDFINDILSDARTAIHEASQLKVFVTRQSNVNKNHLKRKSGPNFVEVDGNPNEVKYVAPDPVSKQAMQIAFQVKDEIYNTSGVSQWSATANKPLGNSVSGKALDTMNDNQSDRFANVETGWQQTRVGLGRCHIDVARSMYAETKNKTKGRRFDEEPDRLTKDDLAPWIRDYEWDKVDIDCGTYTLTLEPVNFITGTRGGKLEEIAEAAKAGLIPDPSMTASLMNEPDIRAMNRPILGPIDRIKKCISGLRKKSVDYMDVAPDDSMNLALAKMMVGGELEYAKAKDAPDWIIERLNRFLDDVKDKETKAAEGMPSLPGAQDKSTIAQPNAQTLMAGGAPPMPGGLPPQPGQQGMPPMGAPGMS